MAMIQPEEIKEVPEAKEAEVDDLPAIQQYACTDCGEWSTMYDKVVAELDETKEHLKAYKADRVKQMAEFTAFKREHHIFTRGIHDLNRLRTVCQDLQNLRIPITDYHSSPEDVAMILQLEPEAKRTAFIARPAQGTATWNLGRSSSHQGRSQHTSTRRHYKGRQLFHRQIIFGVPNQAGHPSFKPWIFQMHDMCAAPSHQIQVVRMHALLTRCILQRQVPR